ncbi:MAG: tRNA pseudouridine(55) synthase TruB [Clostridia bacterium]
MNGIVSLIKPGGMTSHDMVSFVRKCTGIKKVGHTGTLDPGAAGVLPICIGKATKTADLITAQQKQYRAELKLGITTDTQDSYGKIISEKKVDVSIEAIEEVINAFKGTIKQVPPMYSAIKINGQKLYELARKGLEVERKAREVILDEIKIIKVDLQNATVLLDVVCSKGTYIRTLCYDIGQKLGCGAHMSFLLRTRSGLFDIEHSVTVEQFKQHIDKKEWNDILIPIDQMFSDYSSITVVGRAEKKVNNGNPIAVDELEDLKNYYEGEKYRVYNEKGDFLCLSQIIRRSEHELYLKILKSFFEVE